MSQTKAQLISDLVQALAFTATASAPTNGIFLSASNTLSFSTNGTERLQIDSNGELISVRGSFLRNVNTGELVLAGGNATNAGANIKLFGGAHASTPNILVFRRGSTESMRIDSSGNVGIGTSSPDGELDVTGTGDANGGVLVVNDAGVIGVEVVSSQPTILLNENDTTDENYQVRLNSGDLLIQTQTDARTGADTKVTIDSSGNVGIGTTSPSQKLHVNGTAFVADDHIRLLLDSGNGRLQIRSSSDTTNVDIFGSNGQAFFAGNVGIGTSSPSFSNGSGIELQRDGTACLRIHDNTNSKAGEIYADSSGLVIDARGSSAITTFDIGGSEKMRLDNSGRLIVGNTDASGSALRVDAASGTDGPLFDSGGTNNTNHALLVRDSASNQLLRVNNNGNVGIGTSSPTVLLDLESTSPTIKLTDSDASGTPECQISGAGGDLVLEADRDDEKSDSLIKFTVDGSEAARINSSGQVGIGDTSPTKPLTVGTSTPVVLLDDQSSRTLELRGPSSTLVGGVVVTSNNSLILGTNDAERLRVNASGSVGIGTSSPAEKLHVVGDARIEDTSPRLGFHDSNAGSTGNTSGGFETFDSSGNRSCFVGSVGVGGAVAIGTNDTERMRVESGGQVLIAGTATGGNNCKLRVNGDTEQLLTSSSPSAVKKRAISHTYTNLSTTATAMSESLISNACVVDVFLQNIDADQAVFTFTSGRRAGDAHKYSLVSGSNSNCSVSLATNVFTITGLGDNRTYTLTMGTGSIGNAPTLKASSTATGTTKIAMYSVGAF